jgi:hypothetical protein
MNKPKHAANNPNLRGQHASNSLLFGEHDRYAVYAIHTRFDSVQWFVADAMVNDNGLPEIIRQDNDFDNAVNGLEE